MKLGPTQFGVRENTASSRQHAPRLTKGFSNTNQPQRRTPEIQRPTPGMNLPAKIGTPQPLQAASENAATGEREARDCCLLTVHEVAALLRVPASWVYGRLRKRSAERLPGYRLGKYWRFKEHEVLAWVELHRSRSRAD